MVPEDRAVGAAPVVRVAAEVAALEEATVPVVRVAEVVVLEEAAVPAEAISALGAFAR